MSDEEKEPKSGKTVVVILVIIIVILLLIMIIGGYFLYSNNNLNGANETKGAVAQSESLDSSNEFFKVPINDLVLNITNSKGREKLMKLSFSLKSNEPTITDIVENNKAEIIDVVIAQISSRSSEELLTVGGKELLKEELLEEINIVLNDATINNEELKKNSIKKLYFTTFVIK